MRCLPLLLAALALSSLCIMRTGTTYGQGDTSVDSACALPSDIPEANRVFPSTIPDKICMYGFIDDAMLTAVQKINLKAYSKVVLTSEGGQVDAALKIANLIADSGAKTEVSDYCLSSCANYLFVAGKAGTILPGAILGLHGGPVRTYEEFSRRYFDSFRSDVDKYNLAHPNDRRDPIAEFKKKWAATESEVASQADLFRRLTLDVEYIYMGAERYAVVPDDIRSGLHDRSFFWVPRKADLEAIGFNVDLYTVDDAAALQIVSQRKGYKPFLFN